VLGSRNQLTSSGNADLDRRQALTSPGMATWVDLNSDKHCTSCRHLMKGRHCELYVNEMRARLRKPKFLGPHLPHGQRACTRWEEAPQREPGAFKRSPSSGGQTMPSFGERYPKSGYLKAADLQDQPDLVVQIDRVDLDVEIGDKVRDVVRFKNDGRSLVLNHATGTTIASLYGDGIEDWCDEWVALFCDETVMFGNENKPGVRVRPYVPNAGDGSKPVTVKKPTAERPPFDDEINF